MTIDDVPTTGDNVDVRSPKSRRRVGRWIGAGLLVIAIGWLGLTANRFYDPHDRAEREHSLTLPQSATQIDAMGDASFLPYLITGLDRGASTIFVMDRSELDDLRSQVEWGAPPGLLAAASSAIPGNSVYRPSATPWLEGARPSEVLYSEDPPGSADYVVAEIYTLPDDDVVGVWLYSDWN